MTGPGAPTLTIVVPTYQRRDAVQRLLGAFGSQLADAGTGAGVDVLVVVDGSDDGTFEAVQALAYPVELRVLSQANAGLSTTRNVGLREARGDLVWFVDDDMVPTDGLVARHRLAHAGGRPRILMGPCLHPPDGAEVTGPIRAYAERWFGELTKAGAVTEPFDFSAANTSGPAEIWRSVGGFEERLTGWGGEDYEIGLKLLARGVEITFDAEAVAWHHQLRTVGQFCSERRQQGRNLVRIARLHPEAIDDLIPEVRSGRVLRALRRAGRGRTRGYALGASLLTLAARAEGRLPRGSSGRVLQLAEDANQIAGVSELDPEGRYVARYFSAPA